MATRTKSLFCNILHPQKRAFLLSFAKTCQIKLASRAADIDHQLHYYWKQHDSAYAEAFEVAKEIAGDMLEDVAVARATSAPEPSDVLLIFLLKGAKEKYRMASGKLEVTGQINLAIEDRTRQANDRIARLRRVGPDAESAAS